MVSKLNSKLKKIKNNKKWGLGIEHEMQIFHSNDENIIFDAQEAACFVSKDDGKNLDLDNNELKSYQLSSACCKKMDKCYYYPNTKKVNKLLKTDHKNHLTKKELDLLLKIDWELTGRQVNECQTIIKRVPRLMPELVTTKFENRTIQSIVKESIDQENTFMSAIMKSPFTREKVEKYGRLKTHLCGTVGNIKVPIKPTIKSAKYKFEKEKYKDYVGSYHITITLPFQNKIKRSEFVKMHQHAANQIQWLEPLFLTSFFTGDPDSVADGMNKATQGSYRVVNIGWGNLAGSDVRKFGTTGVNRGNNIKSYWRNGLRFKGLHKLNHCIKNAPPQYENSLSILTSDFRTFGEIDIDDEEQMDYCEIYYNPYDCPKLDGAPMYPPYGMEIRIFDHFPSSYLLDLMKIIILICANSKRHEPRKYVYQNKPWIKQLKNILKNGWNASVIPQYIRELNINLGLKLNIDEKLNSFQLFQKVIDKLHKFNYNSELVKLMDKTPNIKPILPQINKLCWELNYNKKLNNQIINTLDKIPDKQKWLYLLEFKQYLFRYGKGRITEKYIGHQIEDILYALENNGNVKLKIKNGNIYKVYINYDN